MLKVTYYLEVTSSWCHWVEPAWAELKNRFARQAEFTWKIALMPSEAFPISKNQCEWFYRRSGSIMRSPYMLNSGWWEADIKGYVAPSLVAEAARDLGSGGDTVRLAIAESAVRGGERVGRWEVAAAIGAKVSGLAPKTLLARAQSPEIKAKADASTAEFNALQVNQRPTFLIESSIGDRAVFSGLAKVEPLAAAMDAMLSDEIAYASWLAHFGPVPAT
jgi:predicted DsbA family dithiol-disulfide isomerase